MRVVRFDAYVFETLMADLIAHDRKPTAFAVYLHLWFCTNGPEGTPAPRSHQDIAEDVGIAKSSVQTALRLLKRRGLVRATQASTTATPVYAVLAPWRRRGA